MQDSEIFSCCLDRFLPDGETKVCLLLGEKIGQSLSPSLHTRWFRQFGVNVLYLPWSLAAKDDLSSFLRMLQSSASFLGANITIPFKHRVVLAGCAGLSERVRMTQVANTLYREKDQKTGWMLENTDIDGVVASVRALFGQDDRPFEVQVLGGGGAAAAVIYAAAELPNCVEISCYVRSLKQYLTHFQKNLQKKLTIRGLSDLFTDEGQQAQNSVGLRKLLVNTLPLGWQSARQSTGQNVYARQALNNLQAGAHAYLDLLYEETDSCLQARDLGYLALDGALMLKVQAQRSFLLWTGVNPAAGAEDGQPVAGSNLFCRRQI